METFYLPDRATAAESGTVVSIFRVTVWPIGTPETEIGHMRDRHAEIAITGRLHLPPIPDSPDETDFPLIEVCDSIEASRLASLLVQASKRVKFGFPQMITKMHSGLADRHKR
ncbi:hypothetical protein [Billgrantia desiderata]|uniref:hypothetical protein n=1 Tax=Billgrantia desiderata TaxID=52021 RepID=UPI001F327431|nr:hypothetical protein [Halomonas desiderata]MCE8014343.1 hypothetical protein [Halomonas desiderata]